jgi:hypothetical protein
MSRLRTLLAAAILACGAAAAHAQDAPAVAVPRALLTQLYADLDESHDYWITGIERLAAGITATRQDLDGDGVGEWVVKGTSLCGTNCQRWVYRRLPGGRYALLLDAVGSRLEPLPERTNGWRDIRVVSPSSADDAQTRTYVFDGRRYRWREVHDTHLGAGGRRTVYRMVSTRDARGRRGPALEPVDAGCGLWIAARHAACAPGQRAACGPALLTLSSARLPAGRVCVRLRVVTPDAREYLTPAREDGLCGVTAPDPAARGRSRLVLRPRADDWSYLAYFSHAEIQGPGLPTRLSGAATGALMSFAGLLEEKQPLPCLPTHPCPAGRPRARR